MSENKVKKKFVFPSAYTVLVLVMIFAAVLTYIVPAGAYSTLAYDSDNDVFVVTTPKGDTTEYPAVQETLDNFGINAKVENFVNGSIYRPMSIEGTYELVDQNGQGIFQVIRAPISGIYECVEIMVFIFMIGGMIAIVNHIGVFNSGISELARISKGHEKIIIAVVCFLIAMGGTTFGMAEETVAFYPILIPVFMKAGYDAMTGVAAIYLGSCVGCMFSTVNPFSVVIASNAAGITFGDGLAARVIGLIVGILITIWYLFKYGAKIKKDPTKSVMWEQHEELEEFFGVHGDKTDVTSSDTKMQAKDKIILTLFFVTFVVMVYGVVKLGWWFAEMSMLFLVSSIIIGVIGRVPESKFTEVFIQGASDFVGVALVCGCARAVNILLENGYISGTLLHTMSGWVQGMNPILFLIVLTVIFIILGFFVNSSSGLAMLSIPIMAPLADAVGLPRELVVSAYVYGLNIIGLITPTGLILAILQLCKVTYDKWLKWVWPLLVMWIGLAVVMLIVEMQMAA